jgi:L-fuconolactonase
MGALRRDFLPDGLLPLLASIGFDGCVTVQARQTPEETEWLLGLADQHDFIKGVVGWVDLCSPDVESHLERVARHPRLKGIRHLIQDEPDDGFILRPDFRRGVELLKEFGLTYDLLLHPRHLPNAARFVGEFPDQPFVLDHLAKPFIKDRQLSPWKEDLRELARHPNVSCKLSGMVTEANWGEWQPGDFRPYLDAAVEAFGPERLMIGSDWPVCLLSGQYVPVMSLVLEYVRQFPEYTQANILGLNCARFYNIPTE